MTAFATFLFAFAGIVSIWVIFTGAIRLAATITKIRAELYGDASFATMDDYTQHPTQTLRATAVEIPDAPTKKNERSYMATLVLWKSHLPAPLRSKSELTQIQYGIAV